MILRIWHGYTDPEKADEYEALLKREIFSGIERQEIAGFRSIELLLRPVANEVEFIAVMRFDAIANVEAFIGDDYEVAYVPDAARRVLKRFDDRSQRYELRESRTY